ncbi:uncharacterized protein LOC110940518 isoform X2 [Helianthus annuus]|uniref:uncharacterized protein LOC110940518 isoform X2 n=1 Tax=Helianthus annuus TaxID=4232 RepID=UPI000B8FF37F|nr:uncharacterized protein LOC110940518 isoform X2 [Helianthus annuus]
MNKLLPRDIIVRLLDSYSSFLDLSQCLHRCQKVFNPELVKGPWPKQVVTLVIIVDMIAWMQEGGQVGGKHYVEACLSSSEAISYYSSSLWHIYGMLLRFFNLYWNLKGL